MTTAQLRFSASEQRTLMNAKYITPFIESVRAVFFTMVNLDVAIGDPRVVVDQPTHDVSAVIGMSGDVVGSVVVSLPAPVASAIVSKFAGSELALNSADFADALGEIANMIAGAAKARFEGKSVSISIPSVVVGNSHTIARPTRAERISIPCVIDCGEFSIDIAVSDESQRSSVAA